MRLLCLLVGGVLLAETAILAHFQTVRIILFVLHRVIIPLLAFRARQGDLVTHGLPPKLHVSAQLKKASRPVFRALVVI
jgi:hypothetical protein